MRKVTMRFRLFCTFIAIFLLPLMLLGAIGIWWASDTVMKNAVSSYHTTLENVAQRLDEDIKSLDNVVTLFKSDPMITRLTYMQGDTVDYSRISAADLQSYKNELLFHCANSRLYSGVAICFPTKNVVVSTLGLWNLDWFFEDEFAVQGVNLKAWQELLSQNTLLPNQTVHSFGYVKRGLICMRIGATSMVGKVLMSVIFWIDNDTLDAYLNDLSLFSGTVAGLQDERGEWVHTYAKEIPEQAQLTLLANGAPQETYVSGEGKRYTLLTYTSKGLGWRYSVLLPQEDIYDGARSIRNMIFLILGVMSVVGFALSWELTALNYRPLDRIFHVLGAHFKTGTNPTNREMQEIEAQLSRMIGEQALLRDRISASRPMLQYAVLSHLLEGDVSVAGEGMLSMLDLPLPYPLFGVGLLCGWQGGEMLPQSPVPLCAYLLQKQEHQAVLLNFTQPEDVEEWAQMILDRVQAVFLSAPHSSMSELPKAFEEAVSLSNNQVLEKNVYLYWHEPARQKDGAVYYPQETERELLDALIDGDAEKALSIWETLLQRNKDSHALGKLIVAIELTLNKTDDASGGLAQRLQAISLPTRQTLQEQLMYMRGLLTEAAGYHRERMENQQAAFLNRLLAYIDQHISDEQLSLSTAANELNVSTTYLSRYFKERMHIGYLDYVSRKRIELAKQLLLEEKCAIKDVAIRVGFGNDATFRRVFKKYEGTTPSRM